MNTLPSVSIWLPDGRSSRSHYFSVLVITTVLGSILGLLIDKGPVLFGGVCLLVVVWISLCALARRLHDLGHSGWWGLIALIPIANVFLGLYALFSAGQDHENAYGSPSSTSEQVTAIPQVTEKSVQREIAQPAASAEINRFNAEVPIEVISEPLEEFWAQALHEFDSQSIKSGVWARAYADANGDEKIAKASYIRLRASQLQAAYIAAERRAHAIRDQELQAERERMSQLEAEQIALLAKMSEEERAKALLPKGKCPVCNAVIPLVSEQCPECTALFTADSRWVIKPLSYYEAKAQSTIDQAVIYRSRTQEERSGEGARAVLFLGVLILLLLISVIR